MKRLPVVHAATALLALSGALPAQDWCFAPGVDAAGANPVITLIEDLDGDGDADLVTANNLAGGISVFLGTGTLELGPRTDYATSILPWDLDTGDFDEDGDLDLVVGHDGGGVFSLLLGVGDGTFQPAVNIGAGGGPASLEVALIDGDNHLDVAARSGNQTFMMLGAGDGTFTAGATITDATLSPGIPLSLALADVNNDGDLDHISMGAQGAGFLVRLGAGDGTFGAEAAFPVPIIQATHLKAADLNDDGNMDLVARNFTNSLGIAYGVGDGTFFTATVPSISASLQPSGNFDIVDLDLDGDLDIATAGGATASDLVGLYANNGNGTFAAPVLQGLPLVFSNSSTDGSYGTTAGDLDGDGRPDLVVSYRGSSTQGTNLVIVGNRPADACTLWASLGGGVSGGGVGGTPLLVGTGPLTSGSPYAVSLFRAEPGSTAFLVYGIATLLVPFKGGTLVPDPLVIDPLTVAGDGTVALAGTWPTVISGIDFYLQHWIVDAGGPSGFAASNGLQGTTP